MNYNFCVYIHSNNFNYIPTLVSKYSFTKENKDLDIYIENLDDHPKILSNNNSFFYRSGKKLQWDSTKHQSFFPVRFLCVESHKKNNRKHRWILVIDPDIFCIKSIEILNQYIKEAESKEIPIISHNGESSMMLIDTSIINWTEVDLINDMFIEKNDFNNWMFLKKYKYLNIPSIFNEKDTINNNTILLHTTNTETQPWKTGIKYYESELHNKIKSKNDKLMEFKEHKSCDVKKFVFSLFNEIYNKNIISEEDIKNAINNKYIRPDILKIIKEYENN
jgi:hypothetical protein